MQIEFDVDSKIGEDSVFEGRFVVKGSLRIDGKFEGEALFVEKLHIGAGARVKTNITAASVIIEGIVIGNINADTRILLYPSARVLGDINTPEILIQDGVVMEGKCTICHKDIENTKTFIEKQYDG